MQARRKSVATVYVCVCARWLALKVCTVVVVVVLLLYISRAQESRKIVYTTHRRILCTHVEQKSVGNAAHRITCVYYRSLLLTLAHSLAFVFTCCAVYMYAHTKLRLSALSSLRMFNNTF